MGRHLDISVAALLCREYARYSIVCNQSIR